MVEHDLGGCFRVNGLGRRELAVVAALARPGKVIQIVGPSAAAGNDVFGGEVVRRMVGGTSAVFAPPLRSRLDTSPGLNIYQ